MNVNLLKLIIVAITIIVFIIAIQTGIGSEPVFPETEIIEEYGIKIEAYRGLTK